MGTVIGLAIGNYDFISEKNTFGDLLLPFSPASLHVEETQNEFGETVIKRYFQLPISQVKEVLDYSGHTLSAAQHDFDRAKENKVCIYQRVEEVEKGHLPTADETERFFLFDTWCDAVKKYAFLLANDTYDYDQHKYLALEEERMKPMNVSEAIIMNTLPFGYFGLDYEDIDLWNLFRVIIEAFPDDEVVTLDYTELFEAGWCDETPSEEDYCASKTIVLTEGKFDTEVISGSLQLLYPHMAKFFSFVDFDAYRVQGSTNFVTHYFKLFASLGIKNQVVALFDNDAAGIAELITLRQMRFPRNYSIMTLPDLEIAKNYPTIMDGGVVYHDVNGCACSIEMYLGCDVLTDGGELIPVEWEAFNPKAKVVQGKLQHKKSIQERFRTKIKETKRTGIVEAALWQEMHTLLHSIFSVSQNHEQ